MEAGSDDGQRVVSDSVAYTNSSSGINIVDHTYTMGPPARKKIAVEASAAAAAAALEEARAAAAAAAIAASAEAANASIANMISTVPTTLQQLESIRQSTVQFATELNSFCAAHTFHSTPSLRIPPVLQSPFNTTSVVPEPQQQQQVQQQPQLQQQTGPVPSTATTTNATAEVLPAQPIPPHALPFTLPPLPSLTTHSLLQQQQQLLSAAVVLNNNDPTTDLQLQVCRKIRELLPTSNCAALLQTAQARHWIPILLQWLNLHDRPAVQVEALLAVTSIAEFCASPSLLPASSSTAAAAASSLDWSATNAAVAAMGGSSSSNTIATAATTMPPMTTTSIPSIPVMPASATLSTAPTLPPLPAAAATAAATSSFLMPPQAAGSVPFPPLSFSHSLSREAVAAFDASLATTIQSSRTFQEQNSATRSTAAPPLPLSAMAATSAATSSSLATLSAMSGGINFAPLAPPPGGSHSVVSPSLTGGGSGHFGTTISSTTMGISSSSSAGSTGSYHHASSFLPPPTPVVQQNFGASAAGTTTAAASSIGNNGSYSGSTTSSSSNSMIAYDDSNSLTSFVPHGPVSAASQHVLLRHADAIPTLIALLSSPNRHVYEQALWILGSIAAGDAPPAGSSSSASSNSLLDGGGGGGRSSHHSGHGSSGGTNNSNSNSNLSSNHAEKPVSARDIILAAGVMQPLLRCLESHPNNLSLQRIGAWTLSNLLDNIFQSSSSSSSSPSSGAATSAATTTTGPSLSAASALSQQLQASTASMQQQVTALTSNMNSSAAAAAAAHAAAAATALQSASAAMFPQAAGMAAAAAAAAASGVGTAPNSTTAASLLTGQPSAVATAPPLPPVSSAALTGKISSADEIDMTQLLPVLHRLLHITDSEVLSYICWCLSYLCDGPASHIAAVVTTPAGSKAKPGGLVPRLVELLLHPSWRVTKPALRTIGNIVCAECSDDSDNGGSSPSTTDYTEVILECQAVPRLKELITHSNREIQKEAAWTLSNIAAGTVEQIQAVIDSGAIPPLVNLVRDERTDQEVRSEACWVVLNATSCGSDAQIELLVDEGCVSVLGVLLSEASMVLMALEGLERVLQVEETREMIRRDQIECGEIDDDEENRTPVLVSASLIEHARESHNSSAVIKRADRIWKQHFVSCALCKESYSRHRLADASFCDECKCHVCSNCNCKIYHLDYQEELWAATEEQTEAKKNAKKSKNKKKKAKLKEKKASTKQVQAEVSLDDPKELPFETIKEEPAELESGEADNLKTDKRSPSPSHSGEAADEDDDHSRGSQSNSNNRSNQIDLVLYLQQTGSIIALSKLMDALDFGGDDYDDELDDYERKMIREQQLMRGQAIN